MPGCTAGRTAKGSTRTSRRPRRAPCSRGPIHRFLIPGAAMDDIKNQTRAFLGQFVGAAHLGADEEDLFARGLVNSLFAMQLISWIEKSFDLRVEDEDLEITNFNSVSAIASFVVRKRQVTAGAAMA